MSAIPVQGQLPNNDIEYILNKIQAKYNRDGININIDQKIFITEIDLDSYSALEPVEHYTISVQSTENLLKLTNKFIKNSIVSDIIINKIEVEANESDESKETEDDESKDAFDMVEEEKNKNHLQVDKELDKKLEEKIQITSEHMLKYSERMVTNVEIFSDFFKQCISGENLYFDFTGRGYQNKYYNNLLSIECVYKSIMHHESKMGINRSSYNIIYPISILGYFLKDDTPDFFHAELLILMKRDNEYNFLRFDPWGVQTYNGNNQSLKYDYNENFKYILDQSINKINGRTFSCTYTTPQELGDDIQSSIENLHLTSSPGLCMTICSYISYTFFQIFEGYPGISLNYIKRIIQGYSGFKKDFYNESFIPKFEKFCSISSQVFDIKVKHRTQETRKENKNVISNSRISLNVPVGSTAFINRYREDEITFSLNYIGNSLKSALNQVGVESATYDNIMDAIDAHYKFYIPEKTATVINMINPNILLGLGEFNNPYLWIRQLNFISRMGLFNINKKHKDVFQYCDDTNICKNNLSCVSQNDGKEPVLLFNKLLYSFQDESNNKFCKNNNNQITRIDLNEEERHTLNFLANLPIIFPNCGNMKDVEHKINIYFQHINNLSQSIIKIDRRFYRIFKRMEKIKNTDELKNILVNMFKILIENIYMFRDINKSISLLPFINDIIILLYLLGKPMQTYLDNMKLLLKDNPNITN
jgi:hypothetical protein